MSDFVLRPFRGGDEAAIHLLHGRYAVIDLIDSRATVEPVLDTDGVRKRMAAADWAVVAFSASGSLAGWGSLRSWAEDDGTRVYLTDGYVAPPERGHGLGGRLLHETEAAARRLASGGAVMLGGNASTVQTGRAELLIRNGYRHVFSMVEMEHDGSPAPPRTLPDGITVRSAEVADARPLLALTARAWAGRPFFTLPAENRYRAWLSRSGRALFTVAVGGERVVGFIAASRTPVRAEIEDIQVDPDFRRCGLATWMVAQVLSALADSGGGPVRLHTEADDPAGARSL